MPRDPSEAFDQPIRRFQIRISNWPPDQQDPGPLLDPYKDVEGEDDGSLILTEDMIDEAKWYASRDED